VLGEWLAPGTHVSAVGANAPFKRELDAAAFARSMVVVDSAEQALLESGDLQAAIASGAITREHIHAELGEILTGQKPGRSNDQQITLFKSVGVAVEDIATAAFVYEQAMARGLGVPVRLDADECVEVPVTSPGVASH
jgi:alanine dehydrogenase